MTDEELIELRTHGDRFELTQSCNLVAVLDELAEARAKLTNARAAALEEAARCVEDLPYNDDSPTLAAAAEIRALASLPPSMVVVERSTIEKAKTLLETKLRNMNEGTAACPCQAENLDEHDPECVAVAIEAALALLEKVK